MRQCVGVFGAPKSANAAIIASYLNAHLMEDQMMAAQNPHENENPNGSARGRSFTFKEASEFSVIAKTIDVIVANCLMSFVSFLSHQM